MSWSSVARALALALSAQAASAAVTAKGPDVDPPKDSVNEGLDAFLGRILDSRGQSRGPAFLQIGRGDTKVWVGAFRRLESGFSGEVVQDGDNPMLYRRGDVLTFDRAAILDWGQIGDDGLPQGFARLRHEMATA